MDPISSTLKDCNLFNAIAPSTWEELFRVAELKKYPVGTVIIEKGTLPAGLFIVHNGTAGIYNQEVLLTEVERPVCVGESFIADTTATASIIANTDLEVILIPKNDFFRISDNDPRIMGQLFNITLQRLRNSNETALREAHKRTEELNRMVDERTHSLNETLAELRHTQQFRDQFLANMSHEIRTPMNAIVGLTNLLVQSPLNEQQEKYLQVIKKSGDNLLVIINDILDLSKIEAGKMELESVVFPLHQTISTLQTILSIKAKDKGIELITEIGPDVPEFAVGDETRLTQILMNLTGNAIKFTEQGSVTIQLKNRGSENSNTLIEFSVIDTGIGIPADKLEKIFESFGQASADTTRKYGGTGLGLNISKQLVELHGGKLQVESTPGKGSRFYFSISYPAAEKPDLSASGTRDNALDLSGKKILLVEDNPFNQIVASDTLLLLYPGVEVDIAENGRTAIAMAAENDYVIILMDIQLPDIDGYEITRFIRKEIAAPRNSVPICALTASISTERTNACMAAGMNDFMFKPFTVEDLQGKIFSNIRK